MEICADYEKPAKSCFMRVCLKHTKVFRNKEMGVKVRVLRWEATITNATLN